jgi:hypothetical protein
MIVSLYIQGYKLDLFEDDNIELKSAVADAQDITKVFTDSTNQFSLPATENNNKAFKHFYNANLVDSWDIFNKVKAVIELNGVFYKEVKLQLNKVVMKSNTPVSYDVQLFGLLSNLKDILGDDKLNSLDLSSYDFDYTSSEVVGRLTSSSLLNTICTPLTTKRLIYDSNSATNNTSTVKNVANNNTSFDSGLPFENTSVSLLNIAIISAVESKYGITFSRDFFGQNQFNNLYMLLNGGGVENEIEQQIIFDGVNNDPTTENNRILLSTNQPYSETVFLIIEISCLGGNRTDPFTSSIKANGKEIHSLTANGNGNGDYSYIVKKSEFTTFENLTFHFKSSSILNYRYVIKRYVSILPNILYSSERLHNDLTGVFNVQSKMPDLKIIDYLSGLFKAFKLVAINTTETNVFVDSLENYYNNGSVRDITPYVDFKEIPISVGKLLNEINYKFKEPQTLLQNQFFQNNNVYYGDLEYKLLDENDKLIDGESIDIELPFENMIYERLSDISGVDDTNFMYGYMANESLEPVTVKAHLHYVNRIATTNNIKVLTSSTSSQEISNINVASHTLGFVSPQYSTVFGEEFNEYNGILISNTLYSNFHKSYIDNLFYKNRRIKNVKCKNLPTDFLINLELNDVLIIKEQYYRINNYNLNLITKECDFELYNVANLDLIPSVSITADTTEYTADNAIITTDNNS